MKTAFLREQLTAAETTIRALQDELAETNRGLIALSMELEQRVKARTTELAKSNEALRAEIAEPNESKMRCGERPTTWPARTKTWNSLPLWLRMTFRNRSGQWLVSCNFSRKIMAIGWTQTPTRILATLWMVQNGCRH